MGAGGVRCSRFCAFIVGAVFFSMLDTLVIDHSSLAPPLRSTAHPAFQQRAEQPLPASRPTPMGSWIQAAQLPMSAAARAPAPALPRSDAADRIVNAIDPLRPVAQTAEEARCDERFGYGLVRDWRATKAEFCAPASSPAVDTTITCYEHKQEVRARTTGPGCMPP